MKRAGTVRLWTKAEDDRIRAKYEFMSPKKIGKPMGRTAKAVTARIYRLGLKP